MLSYTNTDAHAKGGQASILFNDATTIGTQGHSFRAKHLGPSIQGQVNAAFSSFLPPIDSMTLATGRPPRRQ